MKKKKPHIFMYVTNQVCAPYRFEFPAKVINQRQNLKATVFYKMNRDVYKELVEEADILIVQRLPMSDTFNKICQALNSMGKLIVFEIDDDLLHLAPHSRFALMAPPNYAERITQSIQSCQAVQCSTKNLAKVVRQYHSEVTVLENHLEHIPPFFEKQVKNEVIIIGYAAGEDHYEDWLTIKTAYNEVISQLESEGHRLETWILGDETIFNSVGSHNKKFFPLTSRDNYLQILNQIDISLIPLADIPFNQSKSDIKFLESSAASCAVIASQVVYSNTIKHNETGCLYDSEEEFSLLLRGLILNRRKVVEMARTAHQYANCNRLIHQHIKNWETTYQNWYSRKEGFLATSKHLCN